MQYRILGPLEINDDGGSVPLGSPKQRAVLGLLLLHAGEPVSAEALVDNLWGETPPLSGANAIQTHVSALRARLGADAIETTARGYRIDPGPGGLDATQFETLIAEAARAESRREHQRSFDMSRRALDLWRGAPLADVAFANGSHPRSVRLTEMHLQTLERWATSALEIGRATETIPELEQVTLEHPLRESLWALRMQALHAAGRDAEALRVYQDLRRVLGEELGIEPSREVQQLEERLLLAEEPAPRDRQIRNPYKGLRPFTEGDAGDFFGREGLIRELVDAVADRTLPLVSLVGPSGSGKSSVVRAGLIPTLRSGVIDGSKDWQYVLFQPGGRPCEELATLLRTDDLSTFPGKLDRLLLLVLDQFEEPFAQASDEALAAFLQLLVDWSRRPELRIVLTLRADFYDRPMLHSEFGRLFVSGVVHVHPLQPEQLAAAASGPAEGVGVRLEPALLSELIRDVTARPGSLPLFQYALTEVFDRRSDAVLTLDAYRAAGGVSGALTRRAEQVFESLLDDHRHALRQILFRLVTVGEGDQVTRRRVSLAELHSLQLDPKPVDEVVERLARHRLVSLDREPTRGEPVVEVAHEALLTEWARLREWLEEARADLRRRMSLAAAREEWLREGCHPGFLLAGSRLEQYEAWAENARVALSDEERQYLNLSTAVRDEELARTQAENARVRRSRRRSAAIRWVSASLVVVAVAVAATSPWESSPLRVGVIAEPGGDLGIRDLILEAITVSERQQGVEFTRTTSLIDVNHDVQELCRAGTDLIVVVLARPFFDMDTQTPECAETMFLFPDFIPVEDFGETSNLASLSFKPEEGSFLAGVAAALNTRSGVVGFVGGAAEAVTPFLSGFEAGVHAVDPESEVLAVWTERFDAPLLGRDAANAVMSEGADVVYHAAGDTGDGVLAAIADRNERGLGPIWFIGVDVDEAITAPSRHRSYVLTSTVKRVDRAVSETIGAFFAGDLEPGTQYYGLANGGLELATTGGHIEPHLHRIEEMRSQLLAGEITIDPWNVQRVKEVFLPPLSITQQAIVTLEAEMCSYDGPTELVDTDVLSVSGNEAAFAAQPLEGAPFSPEPIALGGPMPDLDTDTLDRNYPMLTLPLFPGTWWVGCANDTHIYPAAVIEVSEGR